MKKHTLEDIQVAFNDCTIIRANTSLGNYIKELTEWMTGKTFPRQRMWHIVNNTKDNPGCRTCGGDVKWDDAKKTKYQEYRKYCSKSCQMKNPKFREHKKKVEEERYGPNRRDITAKTRRTVKERYGVDYVSQLEKSKKKKKETVLKKYGVKSVIEYPEFKSKREETMFEKFNVRSYAQLHLDEDTLVLLNNKEWLKNQHHTKKLSISEIADNLNINYEIITRHLKHHNIEIVYYPNSILEKQIFEYVENITPTAKLNDRTTIPPKQIDILVPNKNVAFEVDGIFWHSEKNGRGSKYHLNKTTECSKVGVNLTHIFENEWYDKKDIIKSMISYKLKDKTIKTVYARKCKVVIIEKPDTIKFLNDNHIQGSIHSSINIGLEYEGEIVSCMTFGKSRFTKKYDYEMYRFCSKTFTSVVGGASKLFSYFIKNYDPGVVVSYRDKRRGSNTLYTQLGFELSHTSKPNYFYFLNGGYKLHSRMSFQKHKLKDKLEIFDPNLSEWQNMQLNGYDRIWDCGNDVYVWNKN